MWLLLGEVNSPRVKFVGGSRPSFFHRDIFSGFDKTIHNPDFIYCIVQARVFQGKNSPIFWGGKNIQSCTHFIRAWGWFLHRRLRVKFRAFKVCSKSLGCSTLLLPSFVKSEPSIPRGQVQHVCKNFWGHLQQNKVCMNSYIWWKSEVDYTVQGMIISDVLMHTACGECEQISEYTVTCSSMCMW